MLGRRYSKRRFRGSPEPVHLAEMNNVKKSLKNSKNTSTNRSKKEVLFIEDGHDPVDRFKLYLQIHQLSLFFFHSWTFQSVFSGPEAEIY